MERRVYRYQRPATPRQFTSPDYVRREPAPATPEYGEAKKIRSSDRWQRLRAMVLARYPLCFCCGRPATDVHHREPVARVPKLAFAAANLAPLCEACHEAVHAAERRGVSAEMLIPPEKRVVIA